MINKILELFNKRICFYCNRIKPKDKVRYLSLSKKYRICDVCYNKYIFPFRDD